MLGVTTRAVKTIILFLTCFAVSPLHGGIVTERPEPKSVEQELVDIFLLSRRAAQLTREGVLNAALKAAESALTRIVALQNRPGGFEVYPPRPNSLVSERAALERLIESLRERLGVPTKPSTPNHALQPTGAAVTLAAILRSNPSRPSHIFF